MSIELKDVEEVIRWMGENIFPQKISIVSDKFDEGVLLACVREKIIQRSKAKIGMSPTTMKKVEGYMELTETGWRIFEKLKQSSEMDGRKVK